jgi:lipopolysaccharide exporter
MTHSFPAEPLATAPDGGSPPPRKPGRFGLDVVTLASGATLAEGVSLLLSPILSRFFDPSAFGLLAVFTSIFSIGLLFVCPGYHFALVLPEKDRDAAALLRGTFWIMSAMLIVGGLVIFLLGESLCGWLRVPALQDYLWLLLPALLAGGLNNALRYWNTRQTRFRAISTATVAGSLSRGLARVVACIPGWVGAGTLIVTKVLGEGVAALGLAWTSWRADRTLFSSTPSDVWRLLRRYRKFPLVNIWSNLLGTLSYQAPVILLSMFFSATVVGHYSFGLHLIGLPTIIVGRSVAQVFFQRASEARRQGRLSVVVSETYGHLVRAGLFPILALGIVGSDAFVVMFGAAWAEAGVYVQILALLHFFLFLGQPISMLFSLLERQEVEVAVNLVFLLARVAAIAVGGWFGSPRMALGLQCAVGVVLWLVALSWVFRACAVSRTVLLGVIARSCARGSPYLAVIALAKWWWCWPAPFVLLAAGVGATAYYLSLVWRDPALMRLVTSQWQRWRRP